MATGRGETRGAPEALRSLQRDFTALLRTPLATRGGKLDAPLESYDTGLVAAVLDGSRGTARERLAVYQRQYWLRLFTVMQREFPLSARLVGMYRFNLVTQKYLTDCPPCDHDIGCVANRFVPWYDERPAAFEALGAKVPREAVRQALAVDAAFRKAWTATETPALALGVDDAGRLPAARLLPRPTVSFVREDWPFVELRRGLQEHTESEPLALPARLGRTRHWAVLRASTGIGLARLEPRQSRLYALCSERPLGEAVSRLGDECPSAERAKLPDRVRAWLAHGVELGLWQELDA